MDRAAEELQFFTERDVLKESTKILKSSPKTFALITLTLILPLSVAILAHSLFTLPLMDFLPIEDTLYFRNWTQLFVMQFGYPVILFIFSLVSTAAVVFTVASLCAYKPVSFNSTFFSIPGILKRLFITFIFFFLLVILCNVVFFTGLFAIDTFLYQNHQILSVVSFLVLYFLIFFPIYIYITALWHLANVVSVLEPVYGLEAMKKSKALLKGKTEMAMILVFGYQVFCCEIEGIFCWIHAMVVESVYEVWITVLVGALCVAVLVALNLIGLLVESVFYYVCKSYHDEAIDKSVVYEHLGCYHGESLPLNSSIEMEKLEF